MTLVKMTHPNGLTAEVPASAVGQHTLAGWVLDESQTLPDCPACGRPWPTAEADPPADPPQEAAKQDPAPAESGASSSEPPRRRRKSSEESDV